MFCPNCGADIGEGGRFCVKCGALLPESPSSPSYGSASAAIGAALDDGHQMAAKAASRLNEFAGGHTEITQFKIGDFFADVFKRHTRDEAAELFACGSPKTTPDIRDVVAEWPKPWLYSRVLVVLLVTFIACVALFELVGNPKAIPSIIFIGALIAPFTILIFFFETNAPRNISIASTVEMFFLGGSLSILSIYIFSAIFPGGGSGAVLPSLITGLTEELAKILLIVFFMSRARGKNYILNGLLIGGAVGAGFAVFESAGYAFNALWNNGSYEYMMRTTQVRAFLTLGGHIAWAAIEGAALASCERDGVFDFEQLKDIRFIAFSVACVVLHGIWDMDLPVIDDISVPVLYGPKYILLILGAWFMIVVFLHRGLEQVNQLSNEAKEDTGLTNPTARYPRHQR